MTVKNGEMLICKKCGAVNRQKQYCAFCGAFLTVDMQLGSAVNNHENGTSYVQGAAEPPSATTDTVKTHGSTDLLSLIFGVIGILTYFIDLTTAAALFGLAALILGCVSLTQQKGKELMAVIGVVLGSYLFFVSVVGSFFPFFIYFN